MSKQQRLAFVGVLVLAALLRFVQLGSVPYGVNQDEAERGYEAYSLLHTGHDQHGHRWPLTLEAFSSLHDNASAMSAYAAIPFTALLGPGVWAVRLPSAIAGLLAVFGTMVLGYQVSKRWRVGLIAGFVLAVSPWHLTVSRTGHEAVWVPTLFILGAVAFFAALRQRPWCLPLAVAAWGLGFYGYGPGKAFFPLAAAIAIGVGLKKVRWRHPSTLVALGTAVLLALPLFLLSSAQLGTGRFTEVSVFSSGLLHGAGSVLKNLLTYVNPISWFQGKVTVGPLDWLAFLLGAPFFFILAPRMEQATWQRWLMLGWVAAALVPAVLTDANPNQLRSAGLIGILHVAGAWGFTLVADALRDRFHSIHARGFVVSSITALSIVGLALFWRPAYAMRTGYGQAQPAYTPAIGAVVTALQQQPGDIWIVDDNLNQPQIFIMLLQPWPPQAVAAEHFFIINEAGWYRTTALGRYHFCRRAECPRSRAKSTFVEVSTGEFLGTSLVTRILIRGFSTPLAWYISRNE